VQAILPGKGDKVDSDQCWRLETVLLVLLYIKKVEQLAKRSVQDTSEADSRSGDMAGRVKRLHKSLMRVVKRHIKIQLSADDLT
jgi:hypothetical protein